MQRNSEFLLFDRTAEQYTWRGVALFALAYFGAFAAAGLTAPLVRLWVETGSVWESIPQVAAFLREQPLAKYVDRTRLAFTLFTLLWLIQECGLWGRFGFRKEASAGLFLLGGIGTMVLAVAGQACQAGWAVSAELDSSALFRIILLSALGALLVGWMEEAIFRGMVFRMFYTALNPLPAVGLSALVFAAVHFKGVPAMGSTQHWYAGLEVAALQSVSVFFTADWLPFLNYFLAGLALNFCFLRTHSLLACLSLHAGWVLVRNAWGQAVEIPASNTTRFWGTERIVDGYASLMLTGILVLGFYVSWRRKASREARLAEPAP